MGIDPTTAAAGLTGLGGLLSSIFQPLPYQARNSFAGGGADPTSMLEQAMGNIQGTYQNAQQRANAPVTLPDAVVQPTPSFHGGGLPFTIGAPTPVNAQLPKTIDAHGGSIHPASSLSPNGSPLLSDGTVDNGGADILPPSDWFGAPPTSRPPLPDGTPLNGPLRARFTPGGSASPPNLSASSPAAPPSSASDPSSSSSNPSQNPVMGAIQLLFHLANNPSSSSSSASSQSPLFA